MSNAVMIIVVVSIVFGILYEMYKKYLDYKAKTLAHTSSANERADEQNTALNLQIKKLTERVETLEKIVTDEGYQVQKEINNL
ncbi:hypothetical protein GCM10009111_30490 [Colwellia asteriadis]|uniref:Phage shock protein B n=1 Tax=Colwellia asteriadis TaxID=517723 RepID=A0ABP3WLC6_9GAMM